MENYFKSQIKAELFRSDNMHGASKNYEAEWTKVDTRSAGLKRSKEIRIRQLSDFDGAVCTAREEPIMLVNVHLGNALC